MVPWAIIIPILVGLLGSLLFLKLVADELRLLRHSRVLHKQVEEAQLVVQSTSTSTEN